MTVGNFKEHDELAGTNVITMFSGQLTDIPEGWALCDGNNGTPNLTGKFLRSVPDGATDPGTTGGANSYTLSESELPAHSHTGSTSESGGHTHTYWYSLHPNDFDDNYYFTKIDTHSSEYIGQNGSHDHYSDIDSTGGSSSVNNRPVYYEFAFIMRT